MEKMIKTTSNSPFHKRFKLSNFLMNSKMKRHNEWRDVTKSPSFQEFLTQLKPFNFLRNSTFFMKIVKWTDKFHPSRLRFNIASAVPGTGRVSSVATTAAALRSWRPTLSEGAPQTVPTTGAHPRTVTPPESPASPIGCTMYSASTIAAFGQTTATTTSNTDPLATVGDTSLPLQVSCHLKSLFGICVINMQIFANLELPHFSTDSNQFLIIQLIQDILRIILHIAQILVFLYYSTFSKTSFQNYCGHLAYLCTPCTLLHGFKLIHLILRIQGIFPFSE